MLAILQPGRFVGPAVLLALSLLMLVGLPKSVDRIGPAAVQRPALLTAWAGPVRVVPSETQPAPPASEGAQAPSANEPGPGESGADDGNDAARDPEVAEGEADAQAPQATGGPNTVEPGPRQPIVGSAGAVTVARSAGEPSAPGQTSGQAVTDACTGPLPGGFRDPLPAVPLWNPPGPKRVGLQAGHWQVERVPAELASLQHGAVGGGKQEWEVNLDIARRTAALLEAAGVRVDLLPATVPPRYRAHAFISIHADGDTSGRLQGFKIARPGFSSVPRSDDRLVATLNAAYGPATGLRRDDEHITPRMLYYYAFNSRRYCHAVAPGVPQAIVETGFLTSAADRTLLLGNPDAAARGIAAGVLAFLR
jgi:N-acetylmuramoyl-L-alanine amidase